MGVEGAEIVDSRVDTLLSSHPARYCKRYSLEVATVMKGEMYLAVPADNQPSVMDRDEIVRRAEKGERFLKIYRISHEMELKYQLVPKKEEEADSSVDKPKGRAQKKQKEAAPEQ